MSVNRNDFFREATIRICGSLDIRTALMRAFQYLRDFIPVDDMGLHLYEPGSTVMKSIAKVSASRVAVFDKATPLPDGPGRFDELTKIINHPERDPVTRYMIRRGRPSDFSVLLLKLMMEDGKVGTLSLRIQGNGRYTKEHACLLELLNEPFTIALSNALKHRELMNLKDRLAEDNQYLRKELRDVYGDRIIGEATGLKMVMAMVKQVAPLDSPVLLLGETGVGKDMIANAIHYSSNRKNGPFVKVNCGAIPDTLLDSELFGHEKGAFTGAVAQKRGRFERAHEGTIFLDEVGELLPQAQVRMLRVLQEKEIERIGGTRTVPVDIRLITATNRNLEEMVHAKLFRQDLWFRVNVFPIFIPPLRERKEDIPEFVHYFLNKKSKEMKLPLVPEPAPGAVQTLMDYHWPGNVRELENIIERALILNRGEPLQFRDLLMPVGFGAKLDLSHSHSELPGLDGAMAEHIARAVRMCGGRIHGPGGAADVLGIHPSTLRHRMKKLGVPYGRRTDAKRSGREKK